MKGAVIYEGKYGATLQYAEWISSALKIPLFKPNAITTKELLECDYVVLGSSVYIGEMLIKNWLKSHIAALKNKRLFFFIVCATPSSEMGKQAHIIEKNIPRDLQIHAEIYFLPGRLVKKLLSVKDRILLEIGARFEKDPKKKKVMSQDIDGVEFENIQKMVKFIHEYVATVADTERTVSDVVGNPV